MPEIHHRLIIRHPSRPAILALGEAGGLRLSAFVSDDRHTAEVDYINRAVRDRFALPVTVLRSLRHSDPLGEVVVRAHELQAYGDGAALPPGMDWYGRDELSSQIGPEDQAGIAEWLATSAPPADDGLPLTIEHGDLWPGNFLVDDATCAIIDWEDVAIGHPFLSLAPLIVGLGMFQPRLSSREMTRRLERAYLAGFTELAPPERLREAFRLAAPLSFVDMAVRYRHQRPSVVRLHPWMRDLVPQTLRLALAQLDTDEA